LESIAIGERRDEMKNEFGKSGCGTSHRFISFSFPSFSVGSGNVIFLSAQKFLCSPSSQSSAQLEE
jgi:hypothetical protein